MKILQIMENSIFLARVIGIFISISSVVILLRHKEFLEIEEEAFKSKLYIYLSGFFILIIGTLLIVSHSVWKLDWRIVITLLSWGFFLKGIGRIFFPNSVRHLIEKKRNNHWFIVAEIAALFIGFYLLYYGFMA